MPAAGRMKRATLAILLALHAVPAAAVPAAAEPPACAALRDAGPALTEADDIAALVGRLPPASRLGVVLAEPIDRAALERDGVPPPKGPAAAMRVYRAPLTGKASDLVLETETDALQCRRYHWYRRGDDGRLEPVAGPALDEFESRDGLCRTGGQSLALLQPLGEPAAIIAAMDRRPLDAALDDPPYAGSIALFRLKPEGGADPLCRIKLPPR